MLLYGVQVVWINTHLFPWLRQVRQRPSRKLQHTPLYSVLWDTAHHLNAHTVLTFYELSLIDTETTAVATQMDYKNDYHQPPRSHVYAAWNQQVRRIT